MKKYSGWFMGVLLVIVLACSYKPIKHAIEENPVDKRISFAIYKGSNYTSKAYDRTSAQIHIKVEKVSRGKRTTVWDTTLDAKLLKQYPSMENALLKEIIVPHVIDKKERLEISCILTYKSSGGELQMQYGTVLVNDSGKLDIPI
ncbi:MAG TPA: hypothetical protein PLA68_02525 [Panacibacter sp.]|nr:hypothetical protein [Panacibacter sp.]